MRTPQGCQLGAFSLCQSLLTQTAHVRKTSLLLLFSGIFIFFCVFCCYFSSYHRVWLLRNPRSHKHNQHRFRNRSGNNELCIYHWDHRNHGDVPCLCRSPLLPPAHTNNNPANYLGPAGPTSSCLFNIRVLFTTVIAVTSCKSFDTVIGNVSCVMDDPDAGACYTGTFCISLFL